MTTRFGFALAMLVLQVACTDRRLDDAAEHTDPADDRTHAEIIRDFCKLYLACELDQPVLDWPTCLWYYDFIATNFEMDPDKPPECAAAIWDRLACASEIDSCEDFTAAWISVRPDPKRLCYETVERFDAADCGR